MKIYRNKYLK